ncbi:ABC transporter permease [Massilia sp. GCM10020059]|uniref:Iron ABC transporter permease n=1 Tax=Massilia agrisoli TaxID=2892444 RepID=A0ABS8IYF6_9BURK|nr:iron ABC transporter permease [Massilia agrisoli]MCC6072220.1 iron ABC transporter permease [Massilia agrisoli]
MRRGFPALVVAAMLVAALIAVPILSVTANLLLAGAGDTWSHLASTVLPDYIVNTLILCAGVGIGVIVVGVSTAWLVSIHDFPGRRIFEWALVLPLAVPAYVMAYAYTDLLQFVGPVQTWLRETFELVPGQYWFPDIRTVGGACLVFVFVLYPYVYLLARAAFLERASGMLEAGRSLGLGPWANFFRVSLPLARPAIAAGAALALMETLADFGAVTYFGVPTFTSGIYRAWFSLGDRVAAAQLAALLLGFVAMVLFFERLSRGRARFHNTTGRNRPMPGYRLHGMRAAGAVLVCLLPLALGFLIPGGALLHMALSEGDAQFGERFIQLSRNSFVLAAVTAFAAVVVAVLLAYSARLTGALLPKVINRFVGLGYAVPGSVIAVGILIPVTRLDTWLSGQVQALTGYAPGLLLTGGIGALVYAYLVRFLAVSLQTVETSLAKITPTMDDASRSLGFGHAATLRKIHLPLLRGSLLTAGLLVFVDVMKELPATLVMRPFNFDTLATQAFTLASDERLAEASTAALAIVGVGVLPLVLMSWQIARSRKT